MAGIEQRIMIPRIGCKNADNPRPYIPSVVSKRLPAELYPKIFRPDAKYRIDEPLKEICLDVRDGEVVEGVDFEL